MEGASGSEASVSDVEGAGEFDEESTSQEYHDALPIRSDTKGKASPAAAKRAQATHPQASPTKKSSSWTDLDLSIIVALVSPIGNWLTGGDHIKNIFLIILLIFYLHQIIEIPWQLYLAARPRKSARRTLAPRADEDEDERVAYLTTLAHGELRRSEMLYLSISIVSPFIGAAFLRWVLSALGDHNTLTWFSTTLFVLATGVRPWSHLINRLKDRTLELHTVLHYPDEDSLIRRHEQSERKLRTTLKRVDSLERELLVLRDSVDRLQQLREVCDDITEMLGDVERTAKRSERKGDANRAAQNVRVTALENSLIQLEERRKRDVAAFEAAGIRLPKSDAVLQQARSTLSTLVDKLLYVPRAILLFGLEDPYSHSQHQHKEFRLNLPNNAFANGNGSGNGSTNGNGSLSHPRIRSPDREKHLPHLVPRLATIPEAENSDSDETEGTFVSDREGAGPTAPASPPRKARSKSVGAGSSSSGPSSETGRARKADAPVPTRRQMVYEFAQSAVLWPYRASVRILVAVLPPVQRVMPRV
ncbi:hypothetical protein C8Q80DRAFT_1108746 [Daedaleopsis nitida]|nr:hypothetical protein C8Q80DRAFT_1108746 [Daedaleopsis nitida]